MRDVDRLREKTEFSLDDKQIAGLAVAALLLVGGVFTLGVLVGKHLSAPAPVPASPAELAVVEAKPAVPKAPPEEPPPPPPPPATRDLGEFTVQVGATKDRAEAQRLEQRARAAGLKPYLVEAELGEKGTWYRVRVGAFKDKDAAGRFRRDVERELRSTAVVMSTR